MVVVDLCHRALSLRWRSLQHRSGARKGFHEFVQSVVCGSDNWKMVLLGFWLEANRSGFLLRHTRLQNLEFDGVSGVLPRSDSFNRNGSTFGRLPWRFAKLLDSDGAASSSGEEVICVLFLGVAATVVPEASDRRSCFAQVFLRQGL
jgi:hypothetical protein